MLWEEIESPANNESLPADLDENKAWKSLNYGSEFLSKIDTPKLTKGIVHTTWFDDKIVVNDKVFFKGEWQTVSSIVNDDIVLFVDNKTMKIDAKLCQKYIPIEILICYNGKKFIYRTKVNASDTLEKLKNELFESYKIPRGKIVWYSNSEKLIMEKMPNLFFLKPEDKLLCIITASLPKTFKRFNSNSNSRYCVNLNTIDAIMFVAKKNVKICGFGCNLDTLSNSYLINYKLFINDKLVKHVEVNSFEKIDSRKIGMVYFYNDKSSIPVYVGDQILIVVTYPNARSNIYLLYGTLKSNDFLFDENEDLFSVMSSYVSKNTDKITNATFGQIPELYYD